MSINPRKTPTYSFWPYKVDLNNGRTNIGAIDLTKEPERINEIHELELMPSLKKSILDLNTSDNGMMTLGILCEVDQNTNIWYSYIEFGFRPGYDYSHIDIVSVDDLFFAFLTANHGLPFATSLQPHLSWEVQSVTLYGNNPSHMYSVFLSAQQQDHIEQAYISLVEWLIYEFSVS